MSTDLASQAPLSYAGATITLPDGYSLSESDANGLSARNAAGDLLQLRAQPTNLPGPMLALLGRNRDQFLQLLAHQAPALLKQAIATQAGEQAKPLSDRDITTQIVTLPAGSALFTSTRLIVRDSPRTLALWLLASAKLDRFYVLSISAAAESNAVQSLMSPVLSSLTLSD